MCIGAERGLGFGIHGNNPRLAACGAEIWRFLAGSQHKPRAHATNWANQIQFSSISRGKREFNRAPDYNSGLKPPINPGCSAGRGQISSQGPCYAFRGPRLPHYGHIANQNQALPDLIRTVCVWVTHQTWNIGLHITIKTQRDS